MNDFTKVSLLYPTLALLQIGNLLILFWLTPDDFTRQEKTNFITNCQIFDSYK